MTNAEKMLQKIVEQAEQYPQIRAAVLEGSRTNPQIKSDCFQDFDITYIVKEVETGFHQSYWRDGFGEIRIFSEENSSHKKGIRYVQALLKDGTRLDVTLLSEEAFHNRPIYRGIVLLDKDQLLTDCAASIEESSEMPEETYFQKECAQFLWGCIDIAKGLWRNEIVSVKMIMDSQVRSSLLQMIGWEIAIQTGGPASLGKNFRFLKEYLDNRSWIQLMKTYPDAERERIWDALFIMCNFFRDYAGRVGNALGYLAPEPQIEALIGYLRHVHGLPSNVTEIYPAPQTRATPVEAQIELETPVQPVQEKEPGWSSSTVHA